MVCFEDAPFSGPKILNSCNITCGSTQPLLSIVTCMVHNLPHGTMMLSSFEDASALGMPSENTVIFITIWNGNLNYSSGSRIHLLFNSEPCWISVMQSITVGFFKLACPAWFETYKCCQLSTVSKKIWHKACLTALLKRKGDFQSEVSLL